MIINIIDIQIFQSCNYKIEEFSTSIYPHLPIDECTLEIDPGLLLEVIASIKAEN